jgi:hypothetical protein
MRQQLTRLLTQIEKLETRTAAIAEGLPEWALEGSAGFVMVASQLSELASRVSQAGDPTWFKPSEFTDRAWTEATTLGWKMLESENYGDAWILAVQELARWPEYRYLKQVEQTS